MSWASEADRDDFYDARAEARAEARLEAAADAHDEACVTCSECGERWDPGEHRATRVDPAWVERDECPVRGCGGPAWEWLDADEQRARTDELGTEYERAEEAGDVREMARIDDLLEKLR